MSGANNVKGINSQTKAALMMFLEQLGEPKFLKVTLEDRDWQDFTFYYDDCKLICESKDYGSAIGWGKIKEIIEGIEKKTAPSKRVVSPKDRIVIVCRTIKDEIPGEIENLKYGFPYIIEKLEKLGFSPNQIELLKKTEIREFISDEKLESDMLNNFDMKIFIWLPEEELQLFISKILKSFYERSAKSASFSKDDFTVEVDKYKKNKIKLNGAFDSEKSELLKQIPRALKALSEPEERFQIEGDGIISLSAQPEKLPLITEYLYPKDDLNLREYDLIWPALCKCSNPYRVLHIFENNFQNEDNSKYIIEFIFKNLDFFMQRLNDAHMMANYIGLLSKVLGKHPQLSDEIFALVGRVLQLRTNEYQSLRKGPSINYEEEELSELLEKLFHVYTESKNYDRIEGLLALIFCGFDLVDDDGEHSLYTPSGVFWILRDYVLLNPTENYKKIVNAVSIQYTDNKYKIKFSGFEFAGSTISQAGDNFSISDRHFVSYSLSQALCRFYEQEPDKCWELVCKKIYVKKEEDITEARPDFLNRSIIPVLFFAYKNKEHKEQALGMIKNLITMKKGIPRKTEIIFGMISSNNDFAEADKWELLKAGIESHKYLIQNVFVQQMITEFSAKGYDEAKGILEEWSTDPKKVGFDGEYQLPRSIDRLLAIDDQFDYGIKIFVESISTDYFRKQVGFKVYDYAKNLAQIINKDAAKGLAIIEKVFSSESLENNEQVLIMSAINQIDNNRELSESIFDKFIKPNILTLDEIDSKLSSDESKVQLVRFAEKMADAGLFNKGMEIIRKMFDLTTSESSDDLLEEDSDHNKVLAGEEDLSTNSVVGAIANALHNFYSLEDRGLIPNVIELCEKLVKHHDFYIRLQGLRLLEQLAYNHRKTMPKNNDELFMDRDSAEKVDKIMDDAFLDKENWKSKVITDQLLRVLDKNLGIDTIRARKYLDIIVSTGNDEIISEATSIIINFAFFRSKRFNKVDPKIWETIYGDKSEDLLKFDESPFKECLISLINKGFSKTNSNLANNFWHIVMNNDNLEFFKISHEHLMLMTLQYDRAVFDGIYHFVEDKLDKHFDKCFELWKKSLNTEKEQISEIAKTGDLRKVFDAPFFYNDKILLLVAEKKGDMEFLSWLNFLLDYPKGVIIAYDLDAVVTHLKEIFEPGLLAQVEKTFDLLIERNPLYYHDKKEWQDDARNAH